MSAPIARVQPQLQSQSPSQPRPQAQPSRRPWRGLAWAALALSIFSGWFVVTRLAVTHELRVWDVIALRFGVGAVILLPILLRQGRRLPGIVWADGLLLALLWGAPFVLLVALGLQLTSAAHASSVTPGLMPVFAGLIAWRFLGDLPSRGQWVGYAVIVAGLIGLVAATAVTHPDPAGLGALVAAAVLWALYTLRLRRSSLTPTLATALVCFWSAVLYLPVYFAAGLGRLALASWSELTFQIGYQGVLMSGVAVFSYNRAVQGLGPTGAAAIIALVPVVASLAAIPVLGETPPWGAGVAILALACGVIISAWAATAAPGVRS